MKIRALVMAAAALVVPFTACGSSDNDGGKSTTTTQAGSSTTRSGSSAKPNADKIAASLVADLGLSKAQADCAADKLSKGDFSAEAFRAMEAGKSDQVPAKELKDVTNAIQLSMKACENAGAGGTASTTTAPG